MIRTEIRKILIWKKLLCLLGFGILYFLLFIRPYVNIHPGSYHQTADIAEAITDKYGVSISPEEYEKMKSEAPEKGISAIDRMIAENALFQEYGFHTFQEFNLGSESLTPDEDTALWMEIYDSFSDAEVSEEFTRTIEINVYDMFLDSYRTEALQENGSANGTSVYKDLDDLQRQRVLERNREEVFTILPSVILEDNFQVLQFWSVFVIIGVIFMILPYMVQENQNEMPSLQYCCRKGRGYYLRKLAAGLITSLAVIGISIVFYLITAKINRVTDFWNASASSFSSGYIGWFPWSIGTMSVMSILFTAMMAAGAGMILFAVTRHCRNYISAIALALPLVILAGCYGAFFILDFAEITRGKYMVPMISAVVLGLGVLANLVQYMAEKKRNID